MVVRVNRCSCIGRSIVRRSLHIFLSSGFLSFASAASAQEIEATASPDGFLTIEGTQLLSDACLSASVLLPGAPWGVTEITNAQAFTLAITHSGDEMCAQMMQEVPVSLRVRDNRNHPFVVIYRTYWGFPETLPELSTDPRGQIVMKGFLE